MQIFRFKKNTKKPQYLYFDTYDIKNIDITIDFKTKQIIIINPDYTINKYKFRQFKYIHSWSEDKCN